MWRFVTWERWPGSRQTSHNKRDDVKKDESRHRHTKKMKEFSCTPKRAQKRDEDAVQTVRCRYPFKLFKLRLKPSQPHFPNPVNPITPTAESIFARPPPGRRIVTSHPKATNSSHKPMPVTTSPQVTRRHPLKPSSSHPSHQATPPSTPSPHS